MSSILLENVEKTFFSKTHVQALLNVSVDFKEGEFVSILGPSGCGKSTLLRIIAGLDNATSGKTRVYPKDKNTFAFVFQDSQLLPWRNVLENVLLPLEFRKQPASQNRDLAVQILSELGLSDSLTRYPRELSGGMRMRTSLARALVTTPQILLMDEPFAALDELTRHRLSEQLRRLWTVRKMTVLFVTHSISEAVFLSNRVIVLSERPGHILEDFKLDLPERREPSLRSSLIYQQQVQKLFGVFEQHLLEST